MLPVGVFGLDLQDDEAVGAVQRRVLDQHAEPLVRITRRRIPTGWADVLRLTHNAGIDPGLTAAERGLHCHRRHRRSVRGFRMRAGYWSARRGDYRVIYRLDDDRRPSTSTIAAIAVGH